MINAELQALTELVHLGGTVFITQTHHRKGYIRVSVQSFHGKEYSLEDHSIEECLEGRYFQNALYEQKKEPYDPH